MGYCNRLDSAYNAFLSHRDDAPLYLAVIDAAYRHAARKCAADVADDISQSVATDVWINLGSFQLRNRFSAWVRKITICRVADYYRSVKPLEEMPSDLTACTRATVNSPIDELTADERILLQWREDGYSYRDIAGFLGVSRASAEQTVCRIRKKVLHACQESPSSKRLYIQRPKKERACEHIALSPPLSLIMDASIIERNADDDPAIVPIVLGWRPSYRVIRCSIPDNNVVFGL